MDAKNLVPTLTTTVGQLFSVSLDRRTTRRQARHQDREIYTMSKEDLECKRIVLEIVHRIIQITRLVAEIALRGLVA